MPLTDGSILYAADLTGIRVSVKGYGAVGNGSTDDTAAIQAALAAAVTYGLTAYAPTSAGAYMVDASVGIQMSTAGMRLEMHPAATLKAITNSLATYAVVNVTAADCSITGGTIQGDVSTHTGGTGEWGHCVQIGAAAHRFRAEGVIAKHAWGDGFYVAGGPTDVTLLNCTADANRRQGASIVGATRCRIIGGSYINTGTVAATSPSAGIDVEPNPSSGVNCMDVIIDGAICSGNVGPGIQLVRATAQTTTATVSNSICRSNSIGIYIAGSAGSIAFDLIGNVCTGNTASGINAATGGSSGQINIVGGRCYSNTENGLVATTRVNVAGLTADFNVKAGINLGTGADGSIVSSSVMRSNVTATVGTYNELDVTATGCIVTGCAMIPATSGNRAAYAVILRSGATGGVILGSRATTGATAVSSITPTDLVQLPNLAAAVTTVNAASTDLATVIALTNQIRTLLINNAGLAK